MEIASRSNSRPHHVSHWKLERVDLTSLLIKLVASNNEALAAPQHFEMAFGGRVIEPVVHAPVFRQSFANHRVEGTAHRGLQVFVVKPLVTGPAEGWIEVVLRKCGQGRG